jgi:hypothetical protein
MDKATRKKLETLVWKSTHKDFRGSIDGTKNVLHLVPGKGTCLVGLKDLTDAELLSKVPKKSCILVEERRLRFMTIREWSIEGVRFFETTKLVDPTKGPFLTLEEAMAV